MRSLRFSYEFQWDFLDTKGVKREQSMVFVKREIFFNHYNTQIYQILRDLGIRSRLHFRSYPITPLEDVKYTYTVLGHR